MYPPPALLLFPLLLVGMEKQLWRLPGGAGVEVEVAVSAQLSKRESPRKGRELYSDCSKPRRRFPFRALAGLCPL